MSTIIFQGYVTSNLIITQGYLSVSNIVDSYSESNYNNIQELNTVHPAAGASEYSAIGQSFLVGDGCDVDRVAFYLSKELSSTGVLKVAIYAHTGVYGTSSLPTGDALGTSAGLDISSLSSYPTFTLCNFDFSTSISLAESTNYVVVLYVESGTLNASNCVATGLKIPYPEHDGNACVYGNSSWSIFNNMDFVFYVYREDDSPDPPEPEPTVYAVTIPAVTGGYTDLGVGEHFYEEDTEIEVTAIPYDGYTFSHWLINSTESTDNPYELTVTANVTLTPVFTEVTAADTMTLFDYVLQQLEQTSTETEGLFDKALGVLEETVAPQPWFDVVLEKLEVQSAAMETVLDESVIFNRQIFSREIFYR